MIFIIIIIIADASKCMLIT